MSSDDVLTAVEGDVLIITINRPKARNAVNLAVANGIASALSVLDAHRNLRMGVITGAGGDFCAGMDLKAYAAGERPWLPGGGFAGIAEASPRKPLIAAVEGYALAGGLEIALACDLIVASREARFGIPEVKRGIVAAAGGLMRLPARIPHHIAMELALTGRQMAADEALRHGLLNRLVEPGAALATALDLAKEIAANAPMAVEASKRIILQSRVWADEDMFARQKPFIDPVFGSEDGLEGARAFAEKRAAIWTGR
jgi:enoyl-CoA hydratase